MAVKEGKKTYDLLQVLFLFPGSALGALPLIQRLFGGEQGGLYNLVFGRFAFTGAATFLVPVGIMTVAFAIIVALEIAKKRA